MKAIEVDPRTDERWRRLVTEHDTDVFQSPGWFRVLGASYGFEPRAHVVIDDAGHPLGGITHVEVDSITGRRINVAPFSDYCDPVVGDEDVWALLRDALSRPGNPVVARFRKDGHPMTDPMFQVEGRARWHRIEIADDPDENLAMMDSSARRAIRKGQRSGLQLRDASDLSDLRSFFDLHLRVRKYKYRLLAQPFRFFEAIWREFIESGNGRLTLALDDDVPVAGVLFLTWRDRLYYKFNASDSDALVHRPNDLIVWDAICRGSESRYSRLDFGLSDWDQEGLARYKRKFGALEGTISFLRHDPPDSIGPTLPIAPPLSELTALLTADGVPDEITEKAGDLLYRFFA